MDENVKPMWTDHLPPPKAVDSSLVEEAPLPKKVKALN